MHIKKIGIKKLALEVIKECFMDKKWISQHDFDWTIRCYKYLAKEFKNKDYYYFYLAIFNSTFFDKLLSIYSKELLKGYDLGKKYTADIPIPIINDKLKNNILFELIEFGKQIAAGEFFCFEMIDDLLKKYIYKV